MLKTFSIDDIRAWNPCYDPAKHLPENWVGTAIDILRHDTIPPGDKFWVVCREELLDSKTLRLFAVWCARQVEHLLTDQRSKNALIVAEKFANGTATASELAAAEDAAWAAASDAAAAAAEAALSAAWAAALDAAEAAAEAAWDAAEAARDVAEAAAEAVWDAALAARAAALDAAWDAALSAAWAAALAAAEAAWDAQVAHLLTMLTEARNGKEN